MRDYIFAIIILFLFGFLPGQAQTLPAPVQGSVVIMIDGDPHAAFSLPEETILAKETLAQTLKASELRTVSIRTAASPEGKVGENKALSDRRAADALQLVKDWLPELPGEMVHVNSVGEDYETLATLVRESTLAHAGEILYIIQSVPIWVKDGGRIVDSRKKRLMDLHGGKTWRQMREEIFPSLGQTQITFTFGEAPAEPARLSIAQQPVNIYFPVNDATVRPSFKTNSLSIARLDSLLSQRSPVAGDTLVIVGKASLEGPERYNAVLAQRRAEAIRSYITSHYPDYAGVLTVRAEGEPWEEIRATVAADSQLDADTRSAVLDIFDAQLPADRKEALLQSVPGWRAYARELHPAFRAASITPISAFPLAGFEEDFAIADLDWTLPTPGIEFQPDRLTVPALTRGSSLRPVLGLSTNLAYDITYIPNYGLTSVPSLTLEYYPARSRHFTFGFDVEFPAWRHWDEHRFLTIYNITLWTRRYFKSCEERFHGLYLLAGINGTRFGIGWDAKGWQGEGAGASVGIGHKWLLGRSRLFIDTGIALGAFYVQYDPYVFGFDATRRYYYDYAGDPAQFRARNHRFFWAGPTRIYISIGIDLFNRNRR